MQYIYSLLFQVRDYECDLQGIVNNANYQHYTEHTRHQFLLSKGVSFADLHARGIDAVVARMQLQFKRPLHSGDEFVSRLALEKQGIKYVFYQDIFLRQPDERSGEASEVLVFKSVVDCVCLIDGRIGTTPELDRICPPSAGAVD